MKTKKLIAGLLFSLLSTAVLAQIVDRDGDAFIEINSLDDLNEIRNDPTGRTLRGSSEGCPHGLCLGWEFTRDLDFDTNKNGYLDEGDWNGGKPWTPLKVFKPFLGNYHSISNVLITTPVIKNREGRVSYNYGFFDLPDNYIYDRLRFISPKIVVDGSTIPVNAVVNIGVVAGEKNSAQLFYIDVENASITYSRPASLPPLQAPGNIGGIVGYATIDQITNVSFNGDIRVVDRIPHSIGGVVGTAHDGLIYKGKVSGTINGGGHMGGIVGSATNTEIAYVYSDMNISTQGELFSGGIIGNLQLDKDTEMLSAHSAGRIQKGGGFIGLLSGTKTLSLIYSYSKSIVEHNRKNHAQLIGLKDQNAKISNTFSYQISDPEGVVLAPFPTAYTNAIAQSSLGSPWPYLTLAPTMPWISTDNPDASGDYEGIGRLAKQVPQYTCDSPFTFEVKEKNSGSLFGITFRQEILDIFNAKQGLKCIDAKQVDGRCENYEVAYFCSGSGMVPYWTGWLSQDNSSNDDGDYEPAPASVCSKGEPRGIRARMVGIGNEIVGSPQIPKKFALNKGFECVHEDNGPKGKTNCKDYEVRMICPEITTNYPTLLWPY